MNYTFYIIISVSVICIIIFPIIIKRKIQQDFFSQIAIRNLLKYPNSFFCSYTVIEAIKAAIKYRQRNIVDLLTDGKILQVARLIKKYDELSAIMLKAFNNPSAACSKLEKFIKKNPSNNLAIAYLSMLYQTTNNPKQQASWDNVKEKKLPDYFRAQYVLNIAGIALKNGDLEFASLKYYAASRLLNRSKAYFEEAKVYLLLGTMYRFCFVFDVSETLFRSALKIFSSLKDSISCAQTYANMGMLMVGQERFNDADNYFEKALSLLNDQNNYVAAEIKNQKALMLILQTKYKKAEFLLKETYDIHYANKNNNGIAFSLELKALVCWKKQQFTAAVKYAQKAAEFYKKSQNISGMLESMYLWAEVLFNSNKISDAESILRKIIELGKKDSGCFYLANAYNLLGIIFVQKHDFRRAKGLFQQSLDLEQRGVRNSAIAADYTNMGMIEMRCGNRESAKKYLSLALNFAKQADDEELCRLLEQYQNKINN